MTGRRAESSKHETETRSGADRGSDLDFAATLLVRAGEASLRKAERTRLRLLAAIAAELSAGVSRSGLTVAAVAARAGLAHGTLYRYFADLDAALAALVEEFARFVLAALSEARAGEAGSRARVRRVTLVYTRLFAANAGLMRYLVGLGGADAGFAEAYRRLNRDWYRRMAAAIARRRGLDAGDGDEDGGVGAMLPVAYALGGMVDEFLSQLYLRRDPALAGLATDEAAVAELLTDLWWRGAGG